MRHYTFFLPTTLFAFLLIISPGFAFDYANNIDYHTFKTKELTRINDIDYELSVFVAKTKAQKEFEAALKQQRAHNIENFLNQLVAGNLKNYDLSVMQAEYKTLKAVHDRLARDQESFSREKYVAYLVSDLNLRSIQLRIQFVEFVDAIQNGLEKYLTKAHFNKILVDFRQELIFNPRLYEMVYEDILKLGYHKGAESLIYLKAYDKLLDELDVYNAMLMYIHQYVHAVLATDSFIDYLRINLLVNAINQHFGQKDIARKIKKELNISIGQVGASLILFIFLFMCYLISLKMIEYIGKAFHNRIYRHREAEDREAHLNIFLELIRNSLARPIKVFLVLFGLDIIQRLIFITSSRNEGIVYVFESLYSLVAVWALFRMVNYFVFYYSDSFLKKYPTMRKEIINFFLFLSKFLIITVGVLIILANMGVNISGILASLGIGGLAIALAARESLTNVFGSIQIIVDNAFSQGQWIVTEKYQGTVVEIGLRSTRIRTFDNALVFAPNGYLANTEIKNWSKRQLGRRIKMSIGVPYDSRMSDIVKAVDDIRDMLRTHKDIADDTTQYDLARSVQARVLEKEDVFGIRKTLLVYLNDYGDSAINILVYCFSKSTDWEEWLRVKQDVMVKISEIFTKNNLTFAFPSRTLYFGDEPEHSGKRPSDRPPVHHRSCGEVESDAGSTVST